MGNQYHSNRRKVIHWLDMELQNDEVLSDQSEGEVEVQEFSSDECKLNTVLQAMHEKNKNAAKGCLLASSDTSKAPMILERLKKDNQKLSETTLIHIAAFEAYPGEFETSIVQNGTNVDIDLGWTKMMLKEIKDRKVEAISTDQKVELQSICPNLVYLNVHCNNDNVMLHFIDSTGEMAKLMNLPTPETRIGAVWFADIWDDLWNYDNCLTIEFWKDLQAGRIQVGVDSKPSIVAKDIKEFMEKL